MSLGRSRNGVILKSPQEIEEMAEAGRLSAKVLRVTVAFRGLSALP